MKKNFVFVFAILALTAFTIGVVSITQQLSAQTVPETDEPKEPAPEKPEIPDDLRDKMEDELDKAIEEFENGEHGEKPAFAELGIPEWWMNPPEFENHVTFGRGYEMFEGLEGLQEAKDIAEFNAMYEINAKLIGKMEIEKEETDFGYHSSGYLKALKVRIFNAEIVKHDGKYAYFVMMTCSLYNKALEDMDPDDVNEVKETLDLMQKHGAFRIEKADMENLLKAIRNSQDNLCRVFKHPVYELTTEYMYKPKPELDSSPDFESIYPDRAIQNLNKKLKAIVHDVLLDFTAEIGLDNMHKNLDTLFSKTNMFNLTKVDVPITVIQNETDGEITKTIIVKIDHNNILNRCKEFLAQNFIKLDSNHILKLRDMLVEAIKSANK